MTRGRVIQTLKRRRDWLTARVSVSESRQDGRDLAFDRAEIAALEFALAAFEDADAIGLTDLGRLTLADRESIRGALEKREAAA